MKFMVDAQLPRRLVYRLRECGQEAIHTLDLPLKNKTSDPAIEEISLHEKRIVITKDADFIDTFTLHRKPYKLLLISTGNIKNKELETILLKNIDPIIKAFKKYSFIELDRKSVTIHE